jgi:hypothetical protein
MAVGSHGMRKHRGARCELGDRCWASRSRNHQPVLMLNVNVPVGDGRTVSWRKMTEVSLRLLPDHLKTAIASISVICRGFADCMHYETESSNTECPRYVRGSVG